MNQTITDSAGTTWYLKDGILKEAEVVYEIHWVSRGMAPLRKGLVDPMDFVALFPPYKRSDFEV